MKSAAAYMSSKEWIFHPDSITTVGVGLATEPFIKIKLPFTANDILEAIKQALAAVRTGIPHPTDWKAQTESYERNMGYSSKKLHRNFMYCLIEVDETFFYFTPTKNLGSSKGYTYLPANKIKIEISSPAEDIYDALLKSMKISKESVED